MKQDDLTRNPKRLYRLIEEVVETWSSGHVDDLYHSFFTRLGHRLGVRSVYVLEHDSGDMTLSSAQGIEQPPPGRITINGANNWLFEPKRTLAWSRVAPYCQNTFLPPAAIGTVLGGGRWHSAWFVPHSEEPDALLELAVSTLHTLVRHRLDTRHWEGEFDEARRIQEALLPGSIAFPEGLDVAARWVAADRVSGDFHDFIRLSEERMLVALGDASGHGLPAALLARDVVTGLRVAHHAAVTTETAIRSLNKTVAQQSLSSRFASLVVVEIAADGHFRFFNAGHDPPLQTSTNSARALHEGEADLPLGWLDLAHRPRCETLEVGEALVLYTDGICERRDPAGECFGTERLGRRAVRHCGGSASEMAAGVFDAARAFGEGRAWMDDATVVVVRRRTPR